MASGCVVIGFDGGGGREFFNPEFSYPIEQGDIIGFAKTVKEVILSLERDPVPILEKGRLASNYIHEQYSFELEEQDVIGAWRSILSKFKKTT